MTGKYNKESLQHNAQHCVMYWIYFSYHLELMDFIIICYMGYMGKSYVQRTSLDQNAEVYGTFIVHILQL